MILCPPKSVKFEPRVEPQRSKPHRLQPHQILVLDKILKLSHNSFITKIQTLFGLKIIKIYYPTSH